MPESVIPYIPLFAALVIAVGGIIVAVVQTRRSRATRTEALPPTWPEMWAEMARLTEEMAGLKTIVATQSNAIANVLRSAAAQWPSGHPGPTFDQRDLDALGDTIPAAWLHRGETTTGGDPENA